MLSSSESKSDQDENRSRGPTYISITGQYGIYDAVCGVEGEVQTVSLA